MTSWFLFLFCHGLICTVLMALGTSIEKDPNSPLASSLGLRTKLSKSSPKCWDYSQRLYGSLMKKGGASLLITCFICMLCVLGQSQFIVSLAGGILFGLEVLFYLILHLYCQRKVAEHFGLMAQGLYENQKSEDLQEVKNIDQQEVNPSPSPTSIESKKEKGEPKDQKQETPSPLPLNQAQVQSPIQVIQETTSEESAPSNQIEVEKEDNLPKSKVKTSMRLATPVVEEKKSDEPGFTRRIVFDRIPIKKEDQNGSIPRPKLSRANKNKELKEDSNPEEPVPVVVNEENVVYKKALKPGHEESNFQTLLFDYKADFQKPIVNPSKQSGPSFRVLSAAHKADSSSVSTSSQSSDLVEPIVFEESVVEKEEIQEVESTRPLTPFGPNAKEKKSQESEIGTQQFFHSFSSKKQHLFEQEQEDYIASNIVFHDPQQPQPVYHRADLQTKDSVDTHGFFFDPQAEKTDCPLKQKKEKCPHNTIKHDPQSAFCYRHIAASLRKSSMAQPLNKTKKHPQKSSIS